MPMLPSGRHVAISRTPLQKLLDDAASVVNVHKVLTIRQKADLYPYTEILWLIPEDEATPQQVEASFLDGSLPRPPGFVAVQSGYRLSQSDRFTAGWSDEDRQAFWAFIDIRADHLFEEGLAIALAAQKLVRAEPDLHTRLMVGWWDAGVHPAQIGAAVEEGEVPVWDTYDVLAAIDQMRAYMQAMELEGRLLDDRMRETALWSHYVQLMPQLLSWTDLTTPTRTAAAQARNGKWLDVLPADARATLHKQLVYECVALWDHFGPQLEQNFPGPYKIIDLVVISPEGGEYFAR